MKYEHCIDRAPRRATKANSEREEAESAQRVERWCKKGSSVVLVEKDSLFNDILTHDTTDDVSG